MKYTILVTLLALMGLLAFSAAPAEAEVCSRSVIHSSPPPIVRVVTNGHNAVTVWVEGAWVETVQPTGSMRPAVQDGSRVILIPPELRLLVEGRVVLFHPVGQADRRVLHRIYASGVDSDIMPVLLGTGPSGWTLAWDGGWYPVGVTPPTPPLEARYWLTWGDNNCLPDFWQVRYRDVLGVMIGVIE